MFYQSRQVISSGKCMRHLDGSDISSTKTFIEQYPIGKRMRVESLINRIKSMYTPLFSVLFQLSDGYITLYFVF
jgi:hypothetical protein